jgi:DNA-binding MarR family transcriptional regulator
LKILANTIRADLNGIGANFLDEHDPTDRRMVLTHITEHGLEVLTKLDQAHGSFTICAQVAHISSNTLETRRN